MKERRIPFNEQMVRALLAGTKTQTRRIVKPQPHEDCCQLEVGPFNPTIIDRHGEEQPGDERFGAWTLDGEFGWVCPYGQPGDRLWVSETWRHTAGDLDEARRITEDIASGTAVDYRATYIEQCMRDLGFSRDEAEMADDFEEWRHHSHMPQWASRITLEIVSVRVERLQNISESDALAEGCTLECMTPTGDDSGSAIHGPGGFRALWEQINGAESWDANSWVWVVEFKRVKGGAA